MLLRTFGHACLTIEEKIGKPLLVTDPWLVGSCYFNSWFLENYPLKADMEYLLETEFVYFTHEHPDHFHPETISLFSQKTKMIVPNYPTKTMKTSLEEYGFQVIEVEKLKWKKLSEFVSILFIPVIGEDSILLIKTGTVLAINQNDAPLSRANIKRINTLKNNLNIQTTVLLRSYSNASSLNSFFIENERVKVLDKNDFIERVKNTCTDMLVDYYIPFASQAVFLHQSSKWANAYRVSEQDFKKTWDINTKLLPPYVSLNLDNFCFEFTKNINYSGLSREKLRDIETDFLKESAFVLREGDLQEIHRRLSTYRMFFLIGFIRRISFKTSFGEGFSYSCTKDQMSRGMVENPDIVFKVSGQVIKNAFTNDHLEDIGLCQLCEIHLTNSLFAKVHFFQLFFFFHVLSRLKSYGYFSSFDKFLGVARYFMLGSKKINNKTA